MACGENTAINTEMGFVLGTFLLQSNKAIKLQFILGKDTQSTKKVLKL